MSNEQIKITTRIKPVQPITLKTTITEGQISEDVKKDIAQMKSSEITFRLLSEEE